MEKITWSALEYEERERGSDWFWILGIIVITSSLAAIIYENYFLAVLLVLSGVLLGFFAHKKPDEVHYQLGDKGFKIRTRLYAYENIKAFYVQVQHPEDTIHKKPLLFIKSERIFMPIITVPIDERMAEHLTTVFTSKNVPEEKMEEHHSEKIMEFFGF